MSKAPNTSMYGRCHIFKDADHVVNIANKLEIFYDKEEFFDITLIAGIDNVKAKAHRIVLASASDYFLAMFRSTLDDANAEEVKLEYIDGYTLKLILGYLYKTSIEIRPETVETILGAADYFQINTLVTACCEFMESQLDACNCLGVAFFADQHMYTTLYERATAFAYSRFETVCKEKEFLQLDMEQLGKFLFNEEHSAASQEVKFHSVITWIEHDRPHRDQFLCDILSHIRFDLLNPKFIVDCMNTICTTAKQFEQMARWVQWHLSPESRSIMSAEYSEAKAARNKLAFVTGTGQFQIQTFDSNLNKWSYEEWSVPVKNRVDYSTIVVNGKLIVAGGKVCGRITNSIDCFDLETLQWTQLPPMKLARCWPGLAELNGHLYVVGGQSGVNWTTSVEIFDFYYRKWTSSEPLRKPIPYIQVVTINEQLFAVGNYMSSLECYNPKTIKWTTTSRKKDQSVNFGIAAVAGFLYAVGGEYNEEKRRTVERYDPSNNTWQMGTPLELGRLYVRCAALNNRLVACVGYDGVGEWVNLVDEYNPESNEWTTLAPLLSHEFSISSRLLSF